MFHRCGAVVIPGDGRGDDRTAAIEQLHGHAIDAGFACVLHAVGVAVLPDKVAEFGALQLDDQRLHSARRIDDLREIGIRGHHAIAAGYGCLRISDNRAGICGTDNIAAVVGQERIYVRCNLCIGISGNLPDGQLHFTVVELTVELGIRGEVLCQHPVEFIHLCLRQRTQTDRGV